MPQIPKQYQKVQMYTKPTQQVRKRQKDKDYYLKWFLREVSWGILSQNLRPYDLARLEEAREGWEKLRTKRRKQGCQGRSAGGE